MNPLSNTATAVSKVQRCTDLKIALKLRPKTTAIAFLACLIRCEYEVNTYLAEHAKFYSCTFLYSFIGHCTKRKHGPNKVLYTAAAQRRGDDLIVKAD